MRDGDARSEGTGSAGRTGDRTNDPTNDPMNEPTNDLMNDSTNVRETADRLREELQSLRESGCTILVVGEVPADVSRRACTTLGGSPEHELVTVRSGGGCSCHTSHDGRGHTVQWADQARGAAATTEGGDLQFSTTETEHTAQVTTISALAEATAVAIGSAAEDTDPGELRVCVDSLGPVIEATSERAAFRFCHQLTATVREADGLGHVHLPVARDSERATVLGALFDVTVELELFGGEARQRWYLHEAGIVSDWLPIGVSDR